MQHKAMTSTTQPLSTYRVFLTVCESYKAYIEAPSLDAAQEIAEQMYAEQGTDAFEFNGCDDETFFVEEVR